MQIGRFGRKFRNEAISRLTSIFLLLAGVAAVQAQWQTQSILVKPGWSAVFLNVDASYTTLDSLIGGDPNNPIAEIWLWEPVATTAQYLTDPQLPLTGSSQWATWARAGYTNSSVPSTLAGLVGNSGYLIHSLASSNYTWTVKGKPVPPSYNWNLTGVNLIGFPTSPSSPPQLDKFLSLQPALQSAADVYEYLGGPLSAANPIEIYAQNTVTVSRGQAFWIRTGTYFNNYFGPFQVDLGPSGISFGDSTSQTSFHLRNRSAFPVTVQARLLPSEASPAGVTAVTGVPPVVIRGNLNASNMTYQVLTVTASSPVTWTLPAAGQAGSDIVVTIGVNRFGWNATPGALYAGILQFTDNFNYTEVDVPVSAQSSSYSGLWVGSAAITQVGSYLKSYQTDTNGTLVVGTNGAYVVTQVNTNLGPVVSPFAMRLIIHNDGTNANLLQRVFVGRDIYTNSIIATSETLLDPTSLGAARRITSVQFPWSPANAPWTMSGPLYPGAVLTGTVSVDYSDQASNPFLHTYHPDHDNLDASFQNQLSRGSESYDIQRLITLSLAPPGNDFNSLTQYGASFNGGYAETITLLGIGTASRTFQVAGSFSLNRISSVPVLSQPQ